MKKVDNNLIKRIIFIILIVINCMVIFGFSAQVADDSSATSSRVVDFVIEKMGKDKFKNKQDEDLVRDRLTTIVRKSAHFSIYLVLGILTFVYFNTYQIDKKKCIIYSIIFCFIYACSDEFHQKFVEGRSCELRDVCIDTCGATLGNLISLLVIKIKASLVRRSK